MRAIVTVTNRTGHKLPTAYPSRRVWLHVTVRSVGGSLVFESGALREDGSIVGNDNDVDASRFEPHYTRIERPSEVAIYESILGQSAGNVTTGLLAATHYLKDNRLLPSGFDKSTAHADVAVHGDALQDPDFQPGGDVVVYEVPLGDAPGPYEIEVELLYQPIGFRWSENLRGISGFEPQRFVRYYKATARHSATLLGIGSDDCLVNGFTSRLRCKVTTKSSTGCYIQPRDSDASRRKATETRPTVAKVRPNEQSFARGTCKKTLKSVENTVWHSSC